MNPQLHGGDDGIDAEVTVKMRLHWRTDLWLTAEARQQGPPLLRLRSRDRVYIVS